MLLLEKPIRLDEGVNAGIEHHPVKGIWPRGDLRWAMADAYGKPFKKLGQKDAVWGWYLSWRGKKYSVLLGPKYKLSYCVGDKADSQFQQALLRSIRIGVDMNKRKMDETVRALMCGYGYF